MTRVHLTSVTDMQVQKTPQWPELTLHQWQKGRYRDTSMTGAHLTLLTDMQVQRYLNDRSSPYITDRHAGTKIPQWPELTLHYWQTCRYKDTSMTGAHLTLLTDMQVQRYLNDRSSPYSSNMQVWRSVECCVQAATSIECLNKISYWLHTLVVQSKCLTAIWRTLTFKRW